ncbi:MAG TPA: ribulose-phosphate 3-epimerase [Candidatus Gracilibacteria bacterium]|nr:ribulose-phosphate 3-epimerase [Candidatus Gracilibacteria bacterium]
MKISASILSASYAQLNSVVKDLNPLIDSFHLDLMDGNFVPNLSFGPTIIQDLDFQKPVDVHLMVNHPLLFTEAFENEKVRTLFIHVELNNQLVLDSIYQVKSQGKKIGLVLNPETPVDQLFPYLNIIDEVLIMSVHPGFGGQSFLTEVLEKISILKMKNPDLIIKIDGGINQYTIQKAKNYPIDEFIVGSFLFKGNLIEQINLLKS